MNQPGLPQRQTDRIKADFILLLVAVVWGSAFAAQRVAAQYISFSLFNGTRFVLGAIFLLPFWLKSHPRTSLLGKDFWGVILAGCLIFAGTSLQQVGLRWTTAANAGFITGLYVVVIPLLMAIFLRQPPKGIVWIAAILATMGLFLLSTGGSLQLAPGDGYELAGAVMFAMHVILIGWLVKRVDILTISVIQYSICAALSLALGVALDGLSTTGLDRAWWAILYTGIFSVGLGYSLQAVGQKTAPPAEAAIILCGEAMIAALTGWMLLGEELGVIQILGCALMLSGMILAQVIPIISPKKKSKKLKEMARDG
jgi:drug/metabolite transporter (DMT)-like permease